ncbi:hypothetical protein CEUSTIGMA_g2192.t1 [Chlamydomonas eustigma]|uniref:Uncharacterized protein n=1 Tax=Chlamydomonas eustigma TaxID=1157962 RepID=A0A250WVB5_9CHLO|nr:hypothetical protein CEUSTIGMA_g2192.t1 [Chlamydomonas eustigma]|eukprot:GAX74745.1 hypothetical protein CEUSTIGMA_g2192.t1 [Chlamydomonas eustigma]
MVSNQPYKTGPLDRIERGIRRSQEASGSARVDHIASVASTSQGVPNSPPPPSQWTRDDPNLLSPLATIFHPSASQGASAADSALAGITQRTQRGSSKKSEPSLVGDLSSSTSAAHSVKSEDSSHYRTPITTNTTNTTPPIPSEVGPSSKLNPNSDSDPFSAQLLASIQQSVKIYMDQRLQAQEFAAQASQAAFEKKLLEKVERIEDDQAFFRGEVQAQKKSISELRASTDKVAYEVAKLAEQVKAQHELKEDVTDHVTPEDLDQVWNQLNALQNAVFPEVSLSPLSAVDPQESLSFEPPRDNSLQSTSWIENSVYHPISSSHSPAFHNALSGPPSSFSSGYQSSATFDPNPLNPPPQTVLPQPADHAQQHLMPAVLASRNKQRNLPNISEVDHGGHIHAGTRRAPLPHSSPPAHEHPSSSHANSHMSAPPVNSVSHRPPPSIITSTDMPQDSFSLRPPTVQLHLLPSSWIENSLSSSSLPQSPHTPHSALSHSPSPSTSEYQSPVTHNPNPHRVLPQAADHVQHLLVVPSVPNRERDLPRVTEIDHGGSVVPLRVSRSHFGAQGMCNKMPLPPSPLPAPDHSPSPQSSDEGVSHLPYSCAIASPPTPLAGHHPSRSHRSAPISSSSQSLQLPTCHLPPISRHDSSHAPSTSGRSDGPDVPVVLVVGGHYMPLQPAVLTQPFAPRPSGATGAVGPPYTSQSSRTPCVGTSPCKMSDNRSNEECLSTIHNMEKGRKKRAFAEEAAGRKSSAIVKEQLRTATRVYDNEVNSGLIKYNPAISLDPERLLQWYKNYLKGLQTQSRKQGPRRQEHDVRRDERRGERRAPKAPNPLPHLDSDGNQLAKGGPSRGFIFWDSMNQPTGLIWNANDQAAYFEYVLKPSPVPPEVALTTFWEKWDVLHENALTQAHDPKAVANRLKKWVAHTYDPMARNMVGLLCSPTTPPTMVPAPAAAVPLPSVARPNSSRATPVPTASAPPSLTARTSGSKGAKAQVLPTSKSSTTAMEE